ncbi:UNVERIFIED_CONTAM: hypothetical protein RMT77_012354 [Armadillidium vulgare]
MSIGKSKVVPISSNFLIPPPIEKKRFSKNNESLNNSQNNNTQIELFKNSVQKRYSPELILRPDIISSLASKFNYDKEDFGAETITVIGSGDLGRALVSCLKRGGFRAVVASRDPERARQRVESVGGEVVEYSSALDESDIILLAIPFEGFQNLNSHQFQDKIVIDVSNRPPNFDRNGKSMAEILQKQLPEASVVKAFNTLSAYALSRGLIQGSKQVPVSSDNKIAKSKVMELAQKLGFTPVDYGSLLNARKIEDIPLEFFPEWKTALIVTILIYLFIWGVVFLRVQLCPNLQRKEGEPWQWQFFHAFPLKTSGNAAAITSLNLLAACYLPGIIAAYIQIYRGTKYSEFPSWLDKWMRARKQMGLLALLFAAVHVVFALCLKITYGMIVHWEIQSTIVFGGISLTLMAILGITSLPSVSSILTWKEFFYVQSYLGWMSLFTAYIHTVLAELHHIFANEFTCTLLAHHVQIGLVLPTLTFLLKIPLLIPCLNSYVVKIRRGYERNGQKYQKATNAVQPLA